MPIMMGDPYSDPVQKALASGQFLGGQPVVMSDMPPPPIPPPQPIPISMETDPSEGLRMALAQGISNAPVPPIPEAYQPAIARIRSLMEPGPLEQHYNQMATIAPDPVRGFGERLKAIGKGLLLGGLGGAVYGGVDPNAVNRAFRRTQLPALREEAMTEGALRRSRLQDAIALGNLTGIDPITGVQTPMAMAKEASAENAALRAQISGQNTQSLIERRNTLSANEKRKADLAAFNAEIGYLVKGSIKPSPSHVTYLANKYGITLPSGFDPTRHQLGLDVDGNQIMIATTGATAGTATPVTADGKPVKSYETVKEKNRTERAHILAGQGERRLDIEEARLNLQEEKDIEARARREIGKPDPFATDAERAESEKKVQERIKQLREERLRSKPSRTIRADNTGPGTDPNITRRVQRTLPDGRVQYGIIKGKKPNGEAIIDWR